MSTGIATNGTVTGGDGYAFPNDTDNNGIADHLDANYLRMSNRY